MTSINNGMKRDTMLERTNDEGIKIIIEDQARFSKINRTDGFVEPINLIVVKIRLS